MDTPVGGQGGVPMDPNSEKAFLEEFFDQTRYISRLL